MDYFLVHECFFSINLDLGSCYFLLDSDLVYCFLKKLSIQVFSLKLVIKILLITFVCSCKPLDRFQNCIRWYHILRLVKWLVVEVSILIVEPLNKETIKVLQVCSIVIEVEQVRRFGNYHDSCLELEI